MTAARDPPAHYLPSLDDSVRRRAAGRARRSWWATPVGIAVGVGALFVALSCWWLARDRALPYGDAAFHIYTALEFHDGLAAGHWAEPFTWHRDVYPPLTPLIGSLGFFIGGRTVAAPIVAENIVYVPLLALACYRVGRRLNGSLAGCLAVVFALGAPMIAEQFHVFMLDAPLTAMVAATVWLVLESERFERLPIAVAAGALAGLGLLSKQTFPLYVGGFVVLVLAREGGWRNRRGIAAFATTALLIAAPWYVHHAAQIHRTVLDAGTEINVPVLAKPPLLSTANASWYLWALANGVLFTPLLIIATIGTATAAVELARGRRRHDGTVELLGGLALAFAAITAMPHKDVRYAMPLMIFVAVLATGWIARLAFKPRALAIAALALTVTASTIGATFGAGPTFNGPMPGSWRTPRGQGVMPFDRFTIYANHDYMVSKPRHNGDLLRLFDELHAAGVRRVTIFRSQAPKEDIYFNADGLLVFLRIAHLDPSTAGTSDATAAGIGLRLATLIHAASLGTARPCASLPDGGGVWIRLGDPYARRARDYCPRFTPRFYGP